MQKGFVIGWVLVLVVILVTIGGGYYYWQQKNNPKSQTEVIVSPPITPTPMSTDFPASSSAARGSQQTADWKTYTNQTYGYMIKYPSDWFALYPGGGQFGEKCTENPQNQAITEFMQTKLDDCGFHAEQLPPVQADIVIWVLNQSWTDLHHIIDGPQTDMTIAEEKAVKYARTDRTALPDVNDSRIYLNHNGKGYIVYLKQIDKQGMYPKLYDQILSTFKFTQ